MARFCSNIKLVDDLPWHKKRLEDCPFNKNNSRQTGLLLSSSNIYGKNYF